MIFLHVISLYICPLYVLIYNAVRLLGLRPIFAEQFYIKVPDLLRGAVHGKLLIYQSYTYFSGVQAAHSSCERLRYLRAGISAMVHLVCFLRKGRGKGDLGHSDS